MSAQDKTINELKQASEKLLRLLAGILQSIIKKPNPVHGEQTIAAWLAADKPTFLVTLDPTQKEQSQHLKLALNDAAISFMAVVGPDGSELIFVRDIDAPAVENIIKQLNIELERHGVLIDQQNSPLPKPLKGVLDDIIQDLDPKHGEEEVARSLLNGDPYISTYYEDGAIDALFVQADKLKNNNISYIIIDDDNGGHHILHRVIDDDRVRNLYDNDLSKNRARADMSSRFA